MEKRPRNRPIRKYPDAKRKIFNCEQKICVHCRAELKFRPNWHMAKTVQTLQGPLFLAGRAKMCTNTACTHYGMRYYASQVWLLSLPDSSYGLDVFAYIGWRHEHDQRQLVEIQRELNQKGVEINEQNVGKLYRQYLALLGASSEVKRKKLAAIVDEHGGLILGVDALQPEGHGSLLYVLYEILSGTVVSAIQLEPPNEKDLTDWLMNYQEYPVLANSPIPGATPYPTAATPRDNWSMPTAKSPLPPPTPPGVIRSKPSEQAALRKATSAVSPWHHPPGQVWTLPPG